MPSPSEMASPGESTGKTSQNRHMDRTVRRRTISGVNRDLMESRSYSASKGFPASLRFHNRSTGYVFPVAEQTSRVCTRVSYLRGVYIGSGSRLIPQCIGFSPTAKALALSKRLKFARATQVRENRIVSRSIFVVA